jgi:c-di-GMP-related signal transduction protein
MHLSPKQLVKAVTAGALVSLFAIPQSMIAESTEQLVSPSDLQKAAVNASQQRQQNLDTLNQFLSSAKAQKAIESAHMNPQEVQKAVAGLNDAELAQLAARANKAQSDFAAGNMSDHDLLIILIAVAALILIIVAVH